MLSGILMKINVLLSVWVIQSGILYEICACQIDVQKGSIIVMLRKLVSLQINHVER